MPKPKCTKELIKEAEKLKKTGMSNRDMCACLGIAEGTFYRWINTPSSKLEQELNDTLKKVEGQFKAALRMKIVKKSADNWQAAAWLLERMYPDEYARPEAQFAQRAANDAAQKVIDSMSDVLVKIRETAEDANRADS